MKFALALAAAALLAAPALAEDSDGELNPQELTIDYFKKKAQRGESDPIGCMHGYFATKTGDHDTAVTIFDACVKDRNYAAMTMRSQMHDNGQGGAEDPAVAAELDRQVAEAGYSVGQFNYGLDLMRGRGVDRDVDAGRVWIDRAAAQGLEAAQRLVAADYNLDEVTPDADNWKYESLF